VLLDQALRDKLKARGEEQIKKFSWDSSVGRMLEIFEEVASGRGKAVRKEPAETRA
jgi:hypothetical protein